MAHPFKHRLIFVRHGQTSYNFENRLQGQRDVPLDGVGREQARAIGRYLRKTTSAEIAEIEDGGRFWASPLQRTRETMELARQAMDLAPERYRVDARLKELTFGAWEGLTWAEVAARDPVGAKTREKNKWDFVPPGGESYAMLLERVTPWLAELDGDTFLVAHGGVARAFLTLLAGMPRAEAAGAPIWQGRALIFDNGSAEWIG
jgi:broad specificity phosphatase PhoE